MSLTRLNLFPAPVPNNQEFGGVNLQFGGVKTKKSGGVNNLYDKKYYLCY